MRSKYGATVAALHSGGDNCYSRERVTIKDDPERQADRQDCVWYQVCLDRAARVKVRRGHRPVRCVCAAGCDKYMQERA